MPRRIFIAYAGEDRDQANGFRLLRWNINVEFTFFDRSLLSPVQSQDPDYIKRCIRDQMHGTSVTVVLIGETTHSNDWVEWEIEESARRGNGLLGIRLKGHSTARIPPALTKYGARTINWEPSNFEAAIERAAREAGR